MPTFYFLITLLKSIIYKLSFAFYKYLIIGETLRKIIIQRYRDREKQKEVTKSLGLNKSIILLKNLEKLIKW